MRNIQKNAKIGLITTFKVTRKKLINPNTGIELPAILKSRD